MHEIVIIEPVVKKKQKNIMKTTKKSLEIKHQILPKPFGGRKRPKKKKKRKE